MSVQIVEVPCQRCGVLRRDASAKHAAPLCRDCKGLPVVAVDDADAYELGWTMRRGIRVPIGSTAERFAVCVDCGCRLTWPKATRCRSCRSRYVERVVDLLMARLERNLAATVPSAPATISPTTCSCGCLLMHADESCPCCLLWAERDAVRASWSGNRWAA